MNSRSQGKTSESIHSIYNNPPMKMLIRCVTAASSVLQIGLVSAGAWLHGWAGAGWLMVVISPVVRQRGWARHTSPWLWWRGRALFTVSPSSVVQNQQMTLFWAIHLIAGGSACLRVPCQDG